MFSSLVYLLFVIECPRGCVKLVVPGTRGKRATRITVSLFSGHESNNSLMPQSHPTSGPVRFLSPVRFLVRKAEWSSRRNLTSVLFPWSHQATGPVRLDTAAYLWFGWIIRRTPRVPRAMPVRASYARESSIFFISYGTRTGQVRDPQGCLVAPLRIRKGIDTSIIGKNPARASYLTVRARMGPFRSPHGLFTGCLWSLNPYGSRKLIMHALKLYGPRTGRQNSYGAARGLCGPREWTYSFCSNSPGTARTGPGSVMWLRHE